MVDVVSIFPRINSSANIDFVVGVKVGQRMIRRKCMWYERES